MAATNTSEQVATIAEKIRAGKTSMGIEFGSTRIKAVLIDDEYKTIASGDYGWASHLEHGLIQVGDGPALGDVVLDSSESFWWASEVLVFCQVRNGTSSSPFSSKAR